MKILKSVSQIRDGEGMFLSVEACVRLLHKYLFTRYSDFFLCDLDLFVTG